MMKGQAEATSEGMAMIIVIILMVLIFVFLIFVAPKLFSVISSSSSSTGTAAVPSGKGLVEEIPADLKAWIECKKVTAQDNPYIVVDHKEYGKSDANDATVFSGNKPSSLQMSWPDDQKRLEDLVGRGDNAAIIFLMEGPFAINPINVGIKYDETLGWVMVYDMIGREIKNPYPEDLVSDKMPFWAADLGATLSTSSFEDGIGAILKKFGSASSSVDTCTVHNVHLPQYIDGTEKEKWLPLHGDPQFLLYWNLYPPQEDTWTYQSGWGTTVLIGVISVVPWTKVVGMSARMASAAIKAGAGKAAPILLQKEVEAALKKDFGERAMEWTASEIADTATRLSTWNLVKDAGAAYLQKTVKENLLKSSFKYSLSVATKAGVLSGADAIAEALSKSMIDRLTPQGSYVTLKQDYAAPERLIEATSVPVMVKWTPESTQTYDVFHLASPCHLDQFTFQKSNIICGTYVNGRGLTYCNCDPKTNQCDIPTSGEKYMQCGSFDASLDTVSGYSGLYDKIKGYLSSNSDRKIVDYTLDSDGKASNVKLYLPWTDGDYLSDFNKESTGASSFFSTRDVSNDLFLSATLYDKQGKTKGTQKLRCATAGSENACYDGNSGSADSASFMFSATTPVTVKSSGGDIGIGVGAGMRIAYSLNYDTKYLGIVSTRVALVFASEKLDKVWDSVYVTKLYSNLFSWSGDDKYNLIYLSDIGSDGKPGYIAMDRCKTQAVVADMSNLDNKKSAALVDGKKVDNNYCMRYMSKTAVVVSWGAKVIGGAAFVASMFTPAGWATWAAVALAAGGEVTSGLTDKYAQIWPSSG